MEYILHIPQCVARFPFIPRGRRLHIGSIRARAGCPCLAPAIDGSWRSLGTVRTLCRQWVLDTRLAYGALPRIKRASWLYYQRLDRGWPAVQSQHRATQAAPGPGAGATLTPRHVHRSDQCVRPRDPPRSYHRRPEIDDIRLSDRSVGHRLYALGKTTVLGGLLLIVGRVPKACIVAEVQRDVPFNGRATERAALLRLAECLGQSFR